MLRELTFENIGEVDAGRIKLAVEQHLKKIVTDCIDRPGNDTARTLTLQLNIVPQIDPDTNNCDDVNIEFEVGSKVPKHRSRMVNCAVRKSLNGPMLAFNDLSEADSDQRTLDEAASSFRNDDPPAE